MYKKIHLFFFFFSFSLFLTVSSVSSKKQLYNVLTSQTDVSNKCLVLLTSSRDVRSTSLLHQLLSKIVQYCKLPPQRYYQRHHFTSYWNVCPVRVNINKPIWNWTRPLQGYWGSLQGTINGRCKTELCRVVWVRLSAESSVMSLDNPIARGTEHWTAKTKSWAPGAKTGSYTRIQCQHLRVCVKSWCKANIVFSSVDVNRTWCIWSHLPCLLHHTFGGEK